jgi:hypothetical protein
MSRELIIYTDESTKEGKYFANFYGGALVRSEDIDEVRRILTTAAIDAGLTAEIKWQKVSAGYLDRYVRLIEEFFDLVAADRIKVRIMFTQRLYVPTNLTPEQRENEYHLLYYQFLKHAFGLRFCNESVEPVRLRVYLDNLPDTKEKNARFKGFIAALEKSREFRAARVLVPADQIAEVRSHDHIVLQCLDLVLGPCSSGSTTSTRRSQPDSTSAEAVRSRKKSCTSTSTGGSARSIRISTSGYRRGRTEIGRIGGRIHTGTGSSSPPSGN